MLNRQKNPRFQAEHWPTSLSRPKSLRWPGRELLQGALDNPDSAQNIHEPLLKPFLPRFFNRNSLCFDDFIKIYPHF